MLLTKFKRNITLQERLAKFTGHLVEINGAGLGLEPGRLQHVYKSSFIRVQGELFVPLSLQTIRVFDVKQPAVFRRVGIRTVFQSGKAFSNMKLVLIGSDFIEVQAKGKSPSRILFPLNQVEGIFPV
ncbi:hypothetical protein ACTHSJ_20320 [Paenibacillus cellulositrophicus]|uniref:hypothetical protein n=1 Tax=Paenibacillus TaxID=44249 RepID=UPI000E393154|nr:hypothetical protein [Paenibacillus sp. VMFN-D1]RED31513.1 hypothetical protein C7820_5950 [Paenibacillus sp. VMFN-D1]